MPLIVNELVFKGEIAGPTPRGEPARPQGRPVIDRRAREAIVEACVEEVMKVLEQQGER